MVAAVECGAVKTGVGKAENGAVDRGPGNGADGGAGKKVDRAAVDVTECATEQGADGRLEKAEDCRAGNSWAAGLRM